MFHYMWFLLFLLEELVYKKRNKENPEKERGAGQQLKK